MCVRRRIGECPLRIDSMTSSAMVYIIAAHAFKVPRNIPVHHHIRAKIVDAIQTACKYFKQIKK